MVWLQLMWWNEEKKWAAGSIVKNYHEILNYKAICQTFFFNFVSRIPLSLFMRLNIKKRPDRGVMWQILIGLDFPLEHRTLESLIYSRNLKRKKKNRKKKKKKTQPVNLRFTCPFTVPITHRRPNFAASILPSARINTVAWITGTSRIVKREDAVIIRLALQDRPTVRVSDV